ncbi:hypothetical protein IWW36_000850 [Coemansia brasiliensis]|uniref:Uncharacterized protein n=1 Tax=Coemansia brasiliensis TaxID=2650707 RepID=A0A9W8M0W4_9FUNG|nr:hypothetical protein IWW36_000850 [Coemansia brasiliensis]
MTRVLKLIIFVVLLCAVQVVLAEIVPPTVTEIPNPLGPTEHEYHWWDVFTNRAAEFLGPKVDEAEQLADQAQRSAVKAGDFITSNAAEFGERITDNAGNMAHEAKERVGMFGRKVQKQGERVGEQAAETARDVAQQGKEQAGIFGKWVKREGAKLGDQAASNAQQARDKAAANAQQAKDKAAANVQQAKEQAGMFGHRVKREGENVADRVKGMASHEYVDAQGRKFMHNAKDATEQFNQGFLHNLYSRIIGQAQNTAAATRGASSHLRHELKCGLERLGDMLGTIGHEGASPSWPEAVFEGTKDPMFSKYINELGQVSKQVNARIQSQLDVHSSILEKMALAHLSAQVPLASIYVPVLAMLLIILANQIWTRKRQLHQLAQLQARVAASANGNRTRVIEHGNDVDSTASMYLTLLPLAILLLVVMELSGMAGWLLTSCYTCLVAGTVAATQPSFLTNVWSSDDIHNVGQRLAIGVTTLAAGCCFIHAIFG